MKNLCFTIVLFAFSSIGYSQTVTHNINNVTDGGGMCTGYTFFATFNDSGTCPPNFVAQTCFDVPLGVTAHASTNESCATFMDVNDIRGMILEQQGVAGFHYVSFCDVNNTFQLSGIGSISLAGCITTFTTVIWNIDPMNNEINITIL